MPSQTWSSPLGSSSGSTLTIAYDSLTVAGGTATMVNPRVEFYSKSGWSDSSNSITASGAVTTQTWTNTTLNGGTKTFACTSAALALTYGSPTTADFNVTISNVSFFNGDSTTSNFTLKVQLPARAYSLPPAPTGAAWARTSDVSHAITWTHGSAGASNPIQSTQVERSTNGGAFVQVASLTGAPTSWTDTNTAADSSYVWRIRAYNSTGYSAYATTPTTAYTTPAAPTSASAAKDATGTISVTATNGARYAASFDIEDAPAGGAWVRVASAVQLPWTHANPSTSVTHAYRIRANAIGGMSSTWSATSNTVQMLAAPNAPTNLTSGVADPDEPLQVTWQHNPVDTTSQTKFQIRVRKLGESAWSVANPITATSSTNSFPAGIFAGWASAIEWQVSTWGQSPDQSPWSASSTVLLSRRPVMSIISPTGQLQSGVVAANWTYYDPEATAQAAWWARLHINGALVQSLSGVGQATSVTFSKRVPDGSTVVVSGEVQDSSGQKSLTANGPSVSVVYALPSVPVITVSQDIGTASITVSNPVGGPTVVSNRVLAEDGDGGWRLVGEIGPQGSVTDLTPVLGVLTTYRVEVVSNLPSTRVVDVDVTIEADGRFWLNSASTTLSGLFAVGNPDRQVSSSRSGDDVEFEGRRWPVTHFGGMRRQDIRFSAVLTPTLGSREADFEELAHGDQIVCFRDPTGRRAWCRVVEVAISGKSANLTSLSLTLRRNQSCDVRG